MSELVEQTRALMERVTELVQQSSEIRRQVREMMRRIAETQLTREDPGDGSNAPAYSTTPT
jgi:hypothetical protein